jgi:uncharacterized protein (DUF433 family)
MVAPGYGRQVGSDETGIVSDPAIAFGAATVHGTRIWVALVVGLLADGASEAALLEEYPELTEARIASCRAYGRRLAGDDPYEGA